LDFPSATIITTTTTNRHHTTTTVQDDDEDWLVKDTLLLPNNNDNNHHHDHDHSPDLHSIHHAPPPPLTTVALPLISFGGEQSQSLVAFDDQDPDVMLWKLHLGQTIASVFGIDSNQQWAALQVVANVESYRQDDPHQRQESLDITTTMIRQPLLPTTASDASNADSFPPFAELTDFDSSPYYKESRHGMIPTNQAKLPTQENKSRFPRFVHRHDRSNMAQKRHARRPTDGATVSSSSSSSQQQHLPSPSNNKVGQHDGDDDDDQTTSKALVTIPNSNDPNHEQDDDYYYDYHSHYNFLQEFYNQQQQSNNIIKRRLGNNVILPQTVPLLLLPGPPPPSGLLVMSRTTALVLVLLWSMVWIIGARWWILRNKKERPTDTPAVSAATTSTASETSKDSANNKADRSLTPITGTVQLKAAAPAVSTSATLDPTTTANPPGSTASNTDRPQGETMASGETATNDGTILVDGIIPLLRYSRYKSEFRRIEHLGRGGFGSVVRCQNVLDGREYAIKKIIIDDDLDSNKKDQPFSQRLHRVLREVKSLALLDHVNVVRYYTAWLEHGAITNEEEDDDQHPARDSYYYGSGGDMASISLPKNEQKKPFGSSNVRSWRESSSTLTNAAFQRRPSGSNWSSVVKSAVVGRPNSSWRNHEESLSTSLRHSTNHAGLSSSWEDYGFTFQQSEAGEKEVNELSTVVDLPMVGNTGDGSNDDSHSTTSPLGVDGIGSRLHQKSKKISPPKPKSVERQCTPSTRHTLYIQMQLCSQKTLGDFLSNAEARRGPSRSAAPGCIDIPFALSLFHQIAQGVQHVHRQGLIHRDLKPNNCFIDEGGVVKVGDFGLSREASSSSELNEDTENMESDVGPDDEFNTAGVGTRSYASPEQMNGSDYDSSTDIYSLGIMLFEVCYPMYTVRIQLGLLH
jgi:serine/threonine protein kinase